MKSSEKLIIPAPQINGEAPEVLTAKDEPKKQTEKTVNANTKESIEKADVLKAPAEKADEIKIADLKTSEPKIVDAKEKAAPQVDKKVIEARSTEPDVAKKEDAKKPVDTATVKIAAPSTPKSVSEQPTPAASEIAKEEIIWNAAPPVQNTAKKPEKAVTLAAAELPAPEIKTPDTPPSLAKADNAIPAPEQKPVLLLETKEVKAIQEPTALAEISPTADAKEQISPTPIIKTEPPVKALEVKPIEEAKAVIVEKKTAPVKIEPAEKKQDTKNTAPPVSQEDIANAKKALQEIRIWEGKKGNSLKRRLQEWCKEVKIELVWNTDKSYDLSQNVIISGTLETALNVTFSQAIKQPPSFKITQDGLPKLIIE